MRGVDTLSETVTPARLEILLNLYLTGLVLASSIILVVFFQVNIDFRIF